MEKLKYGLRSEVQNMWGLIAIIVALEIVDVIFGPED